MDTGIVLVCVLILYFAILLGITWFSRTEHEYQGYVIGNRQVGLWGIVTSIAANARDGTAMALWISLAAVFGFGAMWLLMGLLLGFGLIALQAPKIRQEAGEQNYVTIDDVFRYRVGPKLGQVSSLIISITALLYAAGNLYVAGTLTSSLFGISGSYGIVAVTLFVALYLAAGGYMNVIRTDLFQGFLIFVMALAVLVFYKIPPMGDIGQQMADFPSDMKLGFFLLVALFGYTAADQWQRLFSAKSPQIARSSFLVTLPFYAIIMTGVIVFGMAMTEQFPDIAPNELFLALFDQDNISPIIIVLLGIFTLTAAMSTLDTQTYLFSSTIIGALGYDHETDRQKFITTLRGVMVGLLIAMAFVASLIGDVVSYLIDAVTIFLVLSPIIFYVITAKPMQSDFRDTSLALIALICATIHGFMFFMGTFDDGIFLNLVPAGVSTILTLLVPLGVLYLNRKNNSVL